MDCTAHGRLAVRATIVTEPRPLVGAEAEIDGHHHPLASPFQFPEPLVRGEIVGRNRHAEDALGRSMAGGNRLDAGTVD